mgnify:CR=1 FL=1
MAEGYFNDNGEYVFGVDPTKYDEVVSYVSGKYWGARKSWIAEKGSSDGFDDWFLGLLKSRI